MRKNLLLAFTLILIYSVSPAHALLGLFESRQDNAEIELVLRQTPKTPLRIIKHNLKDYGTNKLHVKNVAHTFLFKVKNFSKKNIISYKITIKEYHPFQNIDQQEFVISSVKKLNLKTPIKAMNKELLMKI